MFDYLIKMLVPTLISAVLVYVLGIMRFGLENKLKKMVPFILALTLIMYIAGDVGVCILKPWEFDCSKTIGICPCGLPMEDLLFSFLVVFNISMATLAFSEAEKRTKGMKDFLKYLIFSPGVFEKYFKKREK